MLRLVFYTAILCLTFVMTVDAFLLVLALTSGVKKPNP